MSTTDGSIPGQRLPDELASLAGGEPVTLHLVRHAETEYNVGHRIQGWSDSPITANGHEQIAAVAAALSPVPFDLAFSSDLQRTRTTLEGILAAATSKPPVEFREELREWNFGGHEAELAQTVWGKLHAQQERELGREIEALSEVMSWQDMFDGIAKLDETGQSELAAEIVVRADRALTHILSTTAGLDVDGMRTVLVVSHGGFISTLLRQLVPDVAPDAILPNCSISTVVLDDADFELRGLGVSAASFSFKG